MTFKYLGANVMSNRNLKEEMRAQTTKASGYLRDIIWRNKCKSKIRMYQTCVIYNDLYHDPIRRRRIKTKMRIRFVIPSITYQLLYDNNDNKNKLQ